MKKACAWRRWGEMEGGSVAAACVPRAVGVGRGRHGGKSPASLSPFLSCMAGVGMVAWHGVAGSHAHRGK